PYPRLQVTFGGNDSVRPALEIDAEEFISVKGFKAKGKRITTYQLGEITELEPLRQPEVPETAETETTENPEDDSDLQDLQDITDKPEMPSSPQIIENSLFDDVQ
ncbi:MAG: DNA gyrase/topoisomerase IV subunit A, partial [Muribaculaceae bacterium]|nr:DNA gyrase/topoisomerase IV subunit A [Muribaculaceae bacterium]